MNFKHLHIVELQVYSSGHKPKESPSMITNLFLNPYPLDKTYKF